MRHESLAHALSEVYYAQPLESRHLRTIPDDGLPDLLTVEEAAAVLRIGRSKAYDLARQWRASGGANGLPVLDFGNVLRVPRHALEAMVGGPLHPPAVLRVEAGVSEDPDPSDREARTQARASTRDSRPRRPSRRPAAQLDLFTPPAAS